MQFLVSSEGASHFCRILQQAMGTKDLFIIPTDMLANILYVYDIYIQSLAKQVSTAIFVLFVFYFILSFFFTFFTLKDTSQLPAKDFNFGLYSEHLAIGHGF